MAERNIDALQPGPLNFVPRFDNAIVNVTTSNDVSAGSVRITGPDEQVQKIQSGMRNGEWTLSGSGGAGGVFVSSGDTQSGVVIGGNVVGSSITVSNGNSVSVFSGSFSGPVSFGGGQVTVNGRPVTGAAGDMSVNQPLTIDATLPAGSSVRGELGAGKATLAGDLHSVVASSSAGDIDARTANTNAMRVDSQSGNVAVGNVPAGASVSSRSGNVIAGDVATGARVESRSGNVAARNVGPNAEVTSRSGNVSVHDVASRAEVTSRSGHVVAGRVAQDARVDTTSGSVSVGARVAPTNGPAPGHRPETATNVTASMHQARTHSPAPRTTPSPSAPRQRNPDIQRGGFGVPRRPHQ